MWSADEQLRLNLVRECMAAHVLLMLACAHMCFDLFNCKKISCGVLCAHPPTWKLKHGD